jgi:hypothetical protein
MATRIVLSDADLAALPADGKRYELHKGELYVTAATRPRHQLVVGSLHLILAEHLRRRAWARYTSPRSTWSSRM